MVGRLEGKVAVVTGGVSGMALGTVDMFVSEGAKVVIADIQADKGPGVESRFGSNVRFSHCDIRNEDDIARTVAMAEESFGGLDIMFHCAAKSEPQDGLETITTEGWDLGQANLLRSHVMCIKHSIAAMKKRGKGSIILTSSVSANNFTPGAPLTYVVCKGAVLQLGRWAAFELAKYSIRVNVIVPGAYATSLWGNVVGAPTAIADLMPHYLDEMFEGWQPLPKSGKAEDIGYAATYLASDESAFVTGATLPVDGGLTLFRPQMPKDRMMDYLQSAKQSAEAEYATSHES